MKHREPVCEIWRLLHCTATILERFWPLDNTAYCKRCSSSFWFTFKVKQSNSATSLKLQKFHVGGLTCKYLREWGQDDIIEKLPAAFTVLKQRLLQAFKEGQSLHRALFHSNPESASSNPSYIPLRNRHRTSPQETDHVRKHEKAKLTNMSRSTWSEFVLWVIRNIKECSGHSQSSPVPISLPLNQHRNGHSLGFPTSAVYHFTLRELYEENEHKPTLFYQGAKEDPGQADSPKVAQPRKSWQQTHTQNLMPPSVSH